MITPRHTRLVRVPDLAGFRTVLVDIVAALQPDGARHAFVLVPTRAAGEQLRRTVEDRLLSPERPLVWPLAGTRADWYGELAARLGAVSHTLSAFEREVMLASAARHAVNEGIPPPFSIRPGLVAEMLAFYDMLRRLGRTIDDFERNFAGELGKDCDVDRGAEKLLRQTAFLAAAYRHYESQVAGAARADEHALRDELMARGAMRPLKHMVLTVADRIADPDGLWPADYALLTRLEGLESIDIVCTETVLSAGFIERLHGLFPELEERPAIIAPADRPILVCPPSSRTGDAGATPAFMYRDREEELSAVARRVKYEYRQPHSAPLHRTAVVVRRPLPYLYLARDVFPSAGIPFEALDTLPLAAEPYAAAVDLVLDAVATDFPRAAVLALLRSPHFNLTGAGLTSREIAAFDSALADAKYLGGLDRLEHHALTWAAIDAPASRIERRQKTAAAAASAIVSAVMPLVPLASKQRMSDQLEVLLSWLRRFDVECAPAEDAHHARRARVRAAVLDALTSLAEAYRTHDPEATGDVADVSSGIRRWLGSQTFAQSTGERGLQIVDAQAARYGEFDDVQLVGMIEGEWPERYRRNVLYPSSLLSLLEPMSVVPDSGGRERDALNAARAAFADLVHLARRRVRLSSFVLENDAVVEPSNLLDDLEVLAPVREYAGEAPIRVFQYEALALEPPEPGALPPGAAAWAAARLGARDRAAAKFHGEAGPWTMPRVSVSRLERYLDCPFRFFASEVLKLEEQPEDEDTRTPLERGRFLHELFEAFFAAWQRRGHGRVAPETLGEARALFEEICEDALKALSPAEAVLERARLLGTAVNPGIAHRVFAMEAERSEPILERLLEFPLQRDFTFRARDGKERVVPLSAKADRIDLVSDGTLRVIDYKSKTTPELKIALQLPIYSHCARTVLDGHRNRRWTLAEALYLSFEGARAVVPLRAKHRTLDELIDDAQDRLIGALDDIAAGHFPPRPAKKSLCGPCPYSSVCRLEWVEPPETTGEKQDRDAATAAGAKND